MRGMWMGLMAFAPAAVFAATEEFPEGSEVCVNGREHQGPWTVESVKHGRYRLTSSIYPLTTLEQCDGILPIGLRSGQEVRVDADSFWRRMFGLGSEDQIATVAYGDKNGVRVTRVYGDKDGYVKDWPWYGEVPLPSVEVIFKRRGGREERKEFPLTTLSRNLVFRKGQKVFINAPGEKYHQQNGTVKADTFGEDNLDEVEIELDADLGNGDSETAVVPVKQLKKVAEAQAAGSEAKVVTDGAAKGEQATMTVAPEGEQATTAVATEGEQATTAGPASPASKSFVTGDIEDVSPSSSSGFFAKLFVGVVVLLSVVVGVVRRSAAKTDDDDEDSEEEEEGAETETGKLAHC